MIITYLTIGWESHQIKNLYYVYAVVMIISLCILTVTLYHYMKHTIYYLRRNPRLVGDEEQIWDAYQLACGRLLAGFVCYMFIVLHAFFFYIVFRDFRYVREYPRWQNAIKEMVTEDSMTTRSRSKSGQIM
ncbi:unnamed protein product [Bursaphelenchus okinawaensis]|uniref:Uncharacterized protein n=1 Tax=Bursaphelenchus okinawaensis TaxID=465554 RepID=A0A811LKP9_9BILA|nr:unnamed protein product [Bursaphelenchus okinawaensis]CAG9124037.1 unnamed protein product [Bursaphelenchus okinawaensis]